MSGKSNMSAINATANNLHGKNRKEFWRIYKEEGEEASTAFYQSVIDDEKKDLLKDQPVEHNIFGTGFEQGAINQFNNAARLPVALKAALMPDAHQGYGLPIGGVLALDNAVSPYAVGVDIGCRMKISIFPISNTGGDWHPSFKDVLIEQTRFGMGAAFAPHQKGGLSKHAVMDDPDWDKIQFLKGLKDTASIQLGTSGGGNHFVEWGVVTIKNPNLGYDEQEKTHYYFEEGDQYLALLSHSGSRGVGAKIADRYSKLAMSMHPKLDPDVKHLAWFDMDSEEGQEYWLAMNLAGRFAKANHDVIHQRIADAMGIGEPILSIDNHHNFAWIEYITMQDGSVREAYVHRKGATPAGEDVLGIIPGSMATNGYIVAGKGNADSINSASHGAGRAMSRTQAHKTLNKNEWHKQLKDAGVELIGGSLDEATNAYKDIETVMASQTELVDIQAVFQPRLVRMADDGFAED